MTGALDQIRPGDRVGLFEIVRPLKKNPGGMSRIFEARVASKYRDQAPSHRVALKIALEEHQDALKAEADFLGRFNHPHVVKILPHQKYSDSAPVFVLQHKFDFGWSWYYAMEYIPGGSLLQYLNRPTDVTHLLRQPPTGIYPRSLVQVLGIAEQLLDALQHIHSQHVVNLDIKPGNILIRKQPLGFWRSSVPRVVLVDFGISRDLRFPRAGISGFATVEYMSPEQALSRSTNPPPIDIRSDIFSLGVTLYELLTGQLPFGNLGETLDMGFSPPPPRSIRPSIPSELEALIMRALAKDPQYRFSSAVEMRAAISRVQKPMDWAMTLRRAFSVAALASGIYLGFVAPPHITMPPWKTPEPTRATPTVSIAPTYTPSPTCTPTPKSASPTPTTRSTSTPRPTSTPTPRPPTATPTPTPTSTPRR